MLSWGLDTSTLSHQDAKTDVTSMCVSMAIQHPFLIWGGTADPPGCGTVLWDHVYTTTDLLSAFPQEGS